MANLDLLTEVHTDVKYIRENLEDHIEGCTKLRENVITPLWEKRQQEIGAEKHKRYGGILIGYAINAMIGAAAAYAAIKGLAK